MQSRRGWGYREGLSEKERRESTEEKNTAARIVYEREYCQEPMASQRRETDRSEQPELSIFLLLQLHPRFPAFSWLPRRLLALPPETAENMLPESSRLERE